MFSLTIARIPSAASSTRLEAHRVGDRLHGRARGLDVELHLAAEQPRRQVAEDDVRVGDGRLGRRPCRRRPGRGRRPRTAGPTRSAFVSSGTCAIEPPPAPTVCTLTDGTLIRKWLIEVSRPIVGWPFWQSATSVDVPPMSNVRMLSKPALRATKSAPATPPDGPERTP